MLFVVAPASLMSGYGFLYDQGSTGTPALFQSMAALMQIGCWGVGWMVGGLLGLAGIGLLARRRRARARRGEKNP